MATVAGLSVPARSLALSGALTAVSGVSFVCESTVAPAKDDTVPLLRASGGSRSSVDEALASDQSVESATCLADHTSEFLYSVDWAPTFELAMRMLSGEAGTVLSARASGAEWSLRVLYPGRDALSTAHETCTNHGVPLEVETVQNLDPERPRRFGITTEQREALTAACERGYFDIPREIGLRELAAEMDISHQALSERLRRGHDALISETLSEGARARL